MRSCSIVASALRRRSASRTTPRRTARTPPGSPRPSWRSPDERVRLARVDPVQPRQGLHRRHPGQLLVDVHRVQQRLVEPGLVLLRDHEHLVLRPVEPLRQLPLGKPVDPSLGHRRRLRRVRVDQRPENATSVRSGRSPRSYPFFAMYASTPPACAHRVQARPRDDHRLGLPVDLARGLLPEVLDDHLRLRVQRIRVQRREPGQRRRPLPVSISGSLRGWALASL
jgi:hypothetical protein